MKGHTLKWFTDNQNVVRIVQAGSRKPHLQEGAMSNLHAIHHQVGIPWSKNEIAEYVSCIVDCDDGVGQRPDLQHV